jgi:DNA-binding transcriptional LysR family regulator
VYNLDISLLRTFLELNKTRHFGKTAENLYLTQSAVSSRIKQLEEVLGVTLFQRHRNNIQLTPQGERLIPHAELILNNWTQALQEVSLPESVMQLVIGAPQSVWQAQLTSLPIQLLTQLDNLHIRTESLDSQSILRRLQERTLDIGFVFDQSKIDEVISEQLTYIELKLFSTQPEQSFNDVTEDNYVLVDWGQSFSALHARLLPKIRSPKLHANDWLMAANYLAQTQGFAFLPTSLVERNQYPFFPVADSPSMSRDVYLCYHVSKDKQPDWNTIYSLIKDQVSGD